MPGERFFAPFFAAVDAPPDLRRFILSELRAPSRHWHGLLHHALMLRQLARTPLAPNDRRRLIRAVLFHDIVYDATRSDNEEASAAVARAWVPAPEADAVTALILATKAHDLAAADPLTRLLLEADLSVLWTPSASRYAFYARGIRAEYAHVPNAAYRAGRAAVLTKLEAAIRPAVDAERAAQLRRNLIWEQETARDRRPRPALTPQPASPVCPGSASRVARLARHHSSSTKPIASSPAAAVQRNTGA